MGTILCYTCAQPELWRHECVAPLVSHTSRFQMKHVVWVSSRDLKILNLIPPRPGGPNPMPLYHCAIVWRHAADMYKTRLSSSPLTTLAKRGMCMTKICRSEEEPNVGSLSWIPLMLEENPHPTDHRNLDSLSTSTCQSSPKS
jgi:hypothetical protein